MTDRELMQQALNCLLAWKEESSGYGWSISDQECVEALRARLAQPEPEPVAWFCELPDNKISIKIVGKPTEGNWKPLYTTPPQEPQIKQRTGDCLLTGVCAAEGHRIQKAQRQQRTYTLRKWQGLTDEDVWELAQKTPDFSETVVAIEAKLKEKNT
jgi:hypothetical protein